MQEKEFAQSYKNSLLVSVIIPCYNCQSTVETAVRSIMNQTYDNLEIICIDDGSTDTTLQLLVLLSEEDARVKVVINEENLGLIKTLNKGLSIATGDYIARMDSDDISKKTRIAEELDYINNEGCDICGSYIELIDSEGIVFGKKRIDYPSQYMNYYAFFDTPLYHPTILAKASVLKYLKYDESEESYVIEDYDLWCRALEQGYVIGVCPQYLLYYRYNNQGESVTKREIQSNNFIARALKHQIINGCHLFDRYTAAILYGQMQSERDLAKDLNKAVNLLSQFAKTIEYDKHVVARWKTRKIVLSCILLIGKSPNATNIWTVTTILSKCNLIEVVCALYYFLFDRLWAKFNKIKVVYE